MAEETVYTTGSILPCGHVLDLSKPEGPKLISSAILNGMNYDAVWCPQCKKIHWLLCSFPVDADEKEGGGATGGESANQEVENLIQEEEEFKLQYNTVEEECDKEPPTRMPSIIWEEVPKLEKFMREPPTEEEEKKHKEIKQTLSESQRMAADALKQSIKLKDAEFLLCEDDLTETNSLSDIVQFILSDYANEGCQEVQTRKQQAIPVLRLTKADFDSSQDVKYTTQERVLKKGGFNYIEPGNDWFKVGLRVSGRYEDDEWHKSSDESKLWAVAYHGSNLEGNQKIAEDRIIETAGQGQLHRHDIDVNPFSARVDQMCGTGAYFSNRFDVARGYAKKAANGETCVFEVHLKPSEMRVPQGNLKYAIVNNHLYARPTGIIIRRSVENPSSCQLM